MMLLISHGISSEVDVLLRPPKEHLSIFDVFSTDDPFQSAKPVLWIQILLPDLKNCCFSLTMPSESLPFTQLNLHEENYFLIRLRPGLHGPDPL